MSAAPFDPFQSRREPISASIQKLSQRWADIIHETNTSPLLDDPVADDALSDRLWDEREAVDAQIFAIAGIALYSRDTTNDSPRSRGRCLTLTASGGAG